MHNRRADRYDEVAGFNELCGLVVVLLAVRDEIVGLDVVVKRVLKIQLFLAVCVLQRHKLNIRHIKNGFPVGERNAALLDAA